MTSKITIPIEFELTPRSQAVMVALYKSLDQRFVDPSVPTTSSPAIGEIYPEQGGTYAGLSRGEDGKPDAHLVLIDVVPEGVLSWKNAVAWAEGLGDGAHLPTRFETALLYATLRDQIDSAGWYWTGTQVSVNDAWMQYFGSGGQFIYGKDGTGRARAVRRLEI